MSALLLTSDLVFASRVAAAAIRQSVSVETALSPAALLGKAEGLSLELVIVDLETSRLNLPELIASIRALPNPPRTIVGFGPHVHAELLKAAQEAGCDVVLSRGQFNAQMDELLGHYLVRNA